MEAVMTFVSDVLALPVVTVFVTIVTGTFAARQILGLIKGRR